MSLESYRTLGRSGLRSPLTLGAMLFDDPSWSTASSICASVTTGRVLPARATCLATVVR